MKMQTLLETHVTDQHLSPELIRRQPMSADVFAARCTTITKTLKGHEAHRALDLLTNALLEDLGYGAGIAIFEQAVTHWHADADPYPYNGPCPDCERGPHKDR